MALRLRLQREGCAPELHDVAGGLLIGGGPQDDVRVPGLPPGALAAREAPGGLVIEARAAPVDVGGLLVAPGGRRLARPGERVRAGGLLLWAAPAAPPRGFRLLVLEGPAAGRCLELRDGAVIGRGPTAELRLDDRLASRRHAQVSLARGRAAVRDLGSKNGVAVNGRRAGRAVALRPGDALLLGSTVLGFEGGAAAPGRAGRRRRRRAAALALAAALLALAAALTG